MIDCYCSANAPSLSLQVLRPEVLHPCYECHNSITSWTNSSLSPLSESACLHCQLFVCEQCYEKRTSTPVLLPAVLSCLPPCRLHLLRPITLSPSSTRQPVLCVVTFEDAEPLQSIHPLLHSLLSIQGCSHCRENLDLTVFLYGTEDILQSSAVKELITCLPTARTILIPIRQRNAPLLRYVLINVDIDLFI